MVHPSTSTSTRFTPEIKPSFVPLMREMLANVQFAKPMFFWLLLALPVLWLRFRDQRATIMIWRTAVLLLLILTLADPQSVAEQTQNEERIFAFDVSRSIPPAMRDWMKQYAQERLMARVLALPPRPRSLFLFTDGWETQGNVERLFSSMASANLKIFPIVPADRPDIPDVAVTKLLAPTHGNSGDLINLRVVLENYNNREVEGTLTLARNGETLRTE